MPTSPKIVASVRSDTARPLSSAMMIRALSCDATEEGLVDS